jgi:8-oxo-dGTP diphosphatase
VADPLSAGSPDVRAAGGVVWRPGPHGEPEVLVVHRPRYDDWSLPKGKLDPGETDEECARREVEEETGLRCTLGAELASVSYVDRKGRPKEVRYWAMTVVDGSFVPSEEVDELRWLTVDRARSLLSYRRDGDVLDSFLARIAH